MKHFDWKIDGEGDVGIYINMSGVIIQMFFSETSGNEYTITSLNNHDCGVIPDECLVEIHKRLSKLLEKG